MGFTKALRLKSLLDGMTPGQDVGMVFIQQVYKIPIVNSNSKASTSIPPSLVSDDHLLFHQKVRCNQKRILVPMAPPPAPSIWVHRLCLPSIALGELSQFLGFHPLLLLKDFDLATIHPLS